MLPRASEGRSTHLFFPQRKRRRLRLATTAGQLATRRSRDVFPVTGERFPENDLRSVERLCHNTRVQWRSPRISKRWHCPVRHRSPAHPRAGRRGPANDQSYWKLLSSFDLDQNYCVEKLRKLIANETPPVATAACKRLQQIMDDCTEPPNFGPFAASCNERANMTFPCPGRCCQYPQKHPPRQRR